MGEHGGNASQVHSPSGNPSEVIGTRGKPGLSFLAVELPVEHVSAPSTLSEREGEERCHLKSCFWSAQKWTGAAQIRCAQTETTYFRCLQEGISMNDVP